ncbi:MAG: PQQ-binding-like beta-propeller repeat protein [Chloroflexi bacterium]|nr:PQQ-binding-like beta-propeller repeat protein [Chloroflexota bacterium]
MKRRSLTSITRILALLLVLCFVVIVLASCGSADGISGGGGKAAVVDNDPHSMGYRKLTPEEYEKIKDRIVQLDHISPNDYSMKLKAEELKKEGRQVTKDALRTPPSSVDHSTSTYMPPVSSQAYQGSCGCFSTSYYYKTYQEARDNNWTPNITSRQMSPAFTYNQINGGSDSGSNPLEAMVLIADKGNATWADMPYDQSSYPNYTYWPSETAWRSAIPYRGQYAGTIDISTDSGINTLKQWVANGDMAVIGFQVYDNFYTQYHGGSSPTYKYDNDVIYGNAGVYKGGHAVTVVGYDDNRAYNDGTGVKYGAFKLVNSWGTSWGVSGYFWFSYSYMKSLTDKAAWFMSDRYRYQPTVVGVFGITHPARYDLTIQMGIGPTGSPAYNKTFFSEDGGNIAISSANKIAVDLSDGWNGITSGTNQNYFLRVANYASGDTGSINSMAVEYQGTTVSTETPKNTVSGSYVYVNLTKNVTKTNRTIDLTSPAGGETWGGLHSITWNTGGSDWTAGDQVIIEYSPNGGNTWQNLGIVAYNAASLRGSFSWDTSSLDNTAQGKIRISYKTIQQINEASGNFTLTNGPPAITARDATSVANTSATLNADVLPGTSDTAVWFQWGLTTSYGNETAHQDIGTGNVYEPVSQGITGLSGATTYYFRAVAQNGSGTTYGANGTFRTTAAPTPVTGVASSIGLNQATLNGTVNPNGLSTSAWLEWGETDSYGNSTTHQDIGSGTSAVAVSQGINGLTFETTYHFRVVGQNSLGTTYGNDNTFTTTSPFPYSTGGGIYSSSPAIAGDGSIYVGSDDKKLHALNADGTPKWQYTTGAVLRSSPSIGPDGTLYIGGQDQKLYAINSDGSFKWSYLAGGIIDSSPAVTLDSTIYFGSYDNKLYSLNSDGSFKWSYLTGGDVYSSPAVGPDGKIFFGSVDKYIYALNTNGLLAWRWATTGAIYSSPAINSEGVIYFGSANQYLYALNYDGTFKWSYGTGGLIISSPVIGPDGTIYFGSNDYKLNALNSNGTIKWSYATGGLVRSVPAVSSTGTIYFGSDDDKVYALNPNGSFKWSYLTGGDVISSPTIDSTGRVYVGSLDGKLYRFAGDTALAGSPWPKFRNNNKNNGLTSLPATPTNLAATTVSATQINLSWSDNSGDETGFKIERKTGVGSYAQVDTVGPGQNTYNDEGLTPFTTFYYRVRAYNAAGNSTYSGEASATTLRMVPNITGISPAQSACGAVLTITGAYFGVSQGAGTVTFNGIDAGTAGSWSDTQIVVTVPGQASSGHVVVTVGGEGSSPYQYTILPAVDNITPPQQVTGGIVTITGSGFGSPQGTSTITINGVNTTAATWNTNQITVTVPAASSTGDVIVTVGGNGSSARTLTVIPHIDNIQPGTFKTGSPVTITGSGFGSIQGTTAVFFNGVNADLAASWSNTRITIDVPADAATGNVKVVKETDSNEVAFIVLPTVNSFSPGNGVVGVAVTITGTGFGTIQGSVSIGGAQAPVQSWTNTSVVAAVPGGADQQSDFISITNSEGNSHQSASQFTIDAPSITGITPDSGRAADEITIDGNNFGAQKPAWLEFPVKFFDSVNASVVSWSDTQVKVNVPAAANGGKISLQTAGGTAQSPGQFTVLISVEVTTSIGAGTSVLIDGAEFGAPYTTAWTKGSSHDIGVNSPQTPETGKRYLYDSWSDGGGQTHTVSPSADAVYTASLNTQYYLTVETGPADLPPIPGEGWYDEGQSVNLSAGSPVDHEGEAYYFSEWKVDDAPVPGNPVSVQMTSAKKAKADYQSVDHFEIGNIPGPQTAGQQFDVTISAKDASGATISGFTGTASLSDSTGTLLPGGTDSFAGGVWTGSLTITRAQAAVVVTVSASGKSGTSNAFDVNSAGLDHFDVSNVSSPKTAGQAFSVTLTAQDVYDNTVTSFTSTASLTDTTGTISPATTTAFTAGVWTGDVAITKSEAGVSVTATASGKSGTSSQFDVNPGPLDHFDVSNIASPQTAGQAFGVTLTAQDANNNTVTSFTSTASLTDTTGTINPITTDTFTAGVWTGSLTITGAQSNVQVTASASGKSGTSSQFDVNPGVLDHFGVSNISSPQTAGQAFSVTLTAQDVYDNTVTSFTSTASLTDTTGTLSPTTTAAFTAGVWTGDLTVTGAGTNNTITVSAEGKQGTSSQFDVNPGPLDHFDVSNIGSPQTAGQEFSVTLTAQDANNNTVTSFTSTASLTDTTGTLSPTTTTAFTAGVWTGDVAITKSEAGVSVTATASGKSGTGNQFDVNPGVLDHFDVSNIISPQTAGQAFSVTLTAQDANNNTVTSFTSTADISDTTGTLSPTTTTAFTAGVWTGDVAITKSEVGVSVTATASGKSGTSSQFDVNPGVLDHFDVSNIASPQTAGQEFSVTLTAQDANNNTVTSFTSTASLADTTGTINPITTDTFTAGAWTGSVTITGAQPDVQITATASGKSGTSNQFDVNPGPLDHFTVSNVSSPQIVGQEFNVTLTAQDANNNTVTSFTSTASLTDTTGTINPVTTDAFTAGTWTGSVTITGAQPDVQVTATASGKSGTGNQFDVEPAGLHHFLISNIGSPQTAGQPFSVTLTAQDAHNNTVTSFTSTAAVSDITGTVTPSTTTAFTAGVWTGDLTVTGAGTNNTITVSAEGKSGTSSQFDVNPDVLDHFNVSNIGSPQTAGQAFSVTLTAQDANNNTVTSFTNTASLADTTGTIDPATTGVFTAGAWTGSVTITSAQADVQITAAASGKSGTSSQFDVDPGVLDHFDVSNIASPQTAGQEFGVTLTAQDANNNTVTSFTNTASLTDTTGTINPGATTAFAAGAWTGSVTITGAQSNVQITATASGKSGTSSQFDVNPGPLDHFNVSNIASPQTAGQAFSVTLTAQDANNNTVTSFTSTTSLTDTTGTMSPGATTAFTAGVWAGNVTITGAQPDVQITVTASGKSGTGSQFDVNPGVLDHFNVSNVSSPKTAGQAFSVTLTAQDVYDNTVTSFTNTASLTDTTGTINPPTTGAFTAGTWTGSITVTAAQPDVQITASASGKSGTSNQFDVEPAGLHHFAFGNISSPVTAGQPFPVTIEAKDNYDNTVTGFTDSAELTDSTGTIIVNATTGSFASGVWTGTVTITKAQQDVTMTAAASGKSGTSNSFDVNSGSLDHFSFENISSPQAAGQAFSVTITAQDANDNTVTSFGGTADLADITGTINPAATGAFTSGSWTGNITITGTSASDTITATASGKSGTSNQFAVNHAGLDHFSFNNVSSPQAAGQPFGITITAQDIYNNTVTSFVSTANLTDSTGTIVVNAVTGNFTSGVWSGNVTITKAQSAVTMTATAQGKQGTSNAFDVNSSGLDHFVISNIGSPQTRGVSFPVSITAEDAYSNIVSGFSGTAALSITSGSVTPITTGAFTAGVWSGNLTVNSSGTGLVITAESSGKEGTSNAFDVEEPPALSVTPLSLTFDAVEGQANPPDQEVDVSNTGGGTLGFTVDKAGNWLTVSPLSGNAPQTLTASVDITGMTAGAYNGTITVTGNPGTENSPQVVDVTLNIAPPPYLEVSPQTADFIAMKGWTEPADKTVNVTNSGGGTLEYNIIENADWLNITPLSGAAPDTLTLSATITGLEVGTYSTIVTITGAGNCQNSPQYVNVNAEVTEPPEISLTPTSFTFNTILGAGAPPDQNLRVNNSGGNDLNWTASVDAGWLSVLPASGTAPSNAVVSVTPAGLSAGTYNGVITITGGGGTTNSPQTVPVTLNIAGNRILPCNDNFESYVTGGYPSPYFTPILSGQPPNAGVISEDYAWAGIKSFRQNGGALTPRLDMFPLSTAAGNYITFETAFYIPEGESSTLWIGFGQYNGGSAYVNNAGLRVEGGHIYCGVDDLGTVDTGTWYSVISKCNFTTATMEITIDGELKGYDLPMTDTSFNGFGLYTKNGPAYFDYVHIFEGAAPETVDVWPGDLNNDGDADTFDILNVGAYWNETGYERYPQSSAWAAQNARKWADTNATYADANGDGVVDADDITPILTNYGLVHTLIITGAAGLLALTGIPLLTGIIRRKKDR